MKGSVSDFATPLGHPHTGFRRRHSNRRIHKFPGRAATNRSGPSFCRVVKLLVNENWTSALTENWTTLPLTGHFLFPVRPPRWQGQHGGIRTRVVGVTV